MYNLPPVKTELAPVHDVSYLVLITYTTRYNRNWGGKTKWQHWTNDVAVSTLTCTYALPVAACYFLFVFARCHHY